MSYNGLLFRKRIDRIRVAKLERSDYCEITQTHRNGSDAMVGKLELDSLQDVRDLHYVLGEILRASSEGK